MITAAAGDPAAVGDPAGAPVADPAWFFGYGSLMWRPGFAHDAAEPARLDGWHRALCIYSHHYRGTPERPGLVLGLAPGRSCVGRAMAAPRHREPEILAYLDERELFGAYVYDRLLLPVTLLRTGQTAQAWCYVAKPDHEQYAGDLDEAAVLRHVQGGHGSAGACADYVRNTVAHLREMGIGDARLEALVERLGNDG